MDNSNLKIRKIELNDGEAIQVLIQQMGYAMELELREAQLKKITEDPHSVAFVALSEEKIVGYVHALKCYRLSSPTFIEIVGLVVDENHRIKGIGKTLISFLESQNSITNYRVRCNVNRSSAHSFYKSLGYSVKKEQKVFIKKIS